MKTATQTKVNLNMLDCGPKNAVATIAEKTNKEDKQNIPSEYQVKELIDSLDDGIAKDGLLKLYTTHLQKIKSENLLREIERLIAPVEAAEQRRDLLGMNNASAISAHLSKDLKPNNLLEEIALEQCATLHVVSMRLLGLVLDENGIDIDSGLAGKTGVKMLGAFNQSVETFINLRNSITNNGVNKKTVQVKGGQNIMADKIEINTGGSNGKDTS